MKKFIAAIISIVIVIATVVVSCAYIGFDKIAAAVSVFGFSSDFKDGKKPLSTKSFELLNDKEKLAYIAVFNNADKHKKYIKVPCMSNTEFNRVFFAVKNDNPDLLCFSDSCNMISFSSSCLIEMNYRFEKEECDKKRQQMLDKANEIVSSANKIEDEFERELFIHDYIASSCEYEISDNSSSAYGCLIEGKAVCSGYSRALMLLLEYSGIESTLISGIGESEQYGSENHMWNIVWIDGKPYNVDMTWDDPKSDLGDIVSHLYFNVSTEDILLDHRDLSLETDCVDNEANYFVREGLLFDKYNSDTVKTIQKSLTENVNGGLNYIEIIFSSDSAYNSAVSSIIDNSSPYSDMYKIIDSLEASDNDNIDTSHINFAKDDNKKYLRIMFDSHQN